MKTVGRSKPQRLGLGAEPLVQSLGPNCLICQYEIKANQINSSIEKDLIEGI
jgi:hypothetical protein